MGKVKVFDGEAEGKPSLNRAIKSVAVDAKPRELPMGRLKAGNTAWRTELTWVENLGDDLCGGVKV